MRTLRGWGFSGPDGRMLAPVIIERLDQGGTSRHRIFPAQRVIGEIGKIAERSNSLSATRMHDLFRAALNIASTTTTARPSPPCESVPSPSATPRYWRCRFILQRHEDGRPWRCPDAAAPAQRQHSGHIAVIGMGHGCAGQNASLSNLARRNSIGWPFSDSRWSDNLRPHARQRITAGLRLLVRLLAAPAGFRTAGAVYRRANAAPPKGRRDGRARMNERIGVRQQNQRPLGKRGVAGKSSSEVKGRRWRAANDALDPVCLHLSACGEVASHRRDAMRVGKLSHTSSVTPRRHPHPSPPRKRESGAQSLRG